MGLYKAKNNLVYPCALKIFRLTSRKLDVDKFEFEIIDINSKKRYRYFGEKVKLDPDEKNIKKFNYYGEERVFIKLYKYKIRRIYEETIIDC